jgi:glutamate/tyrosine decarboxylase-like PLP-dependent enzyme
MVERIPSKGMAKEAVLKAMKAYGAGDADWRGGKTWSLVYDAGDEHIAFLKEAHNLYFSENALNPMAFKSLRRMEHEVVRMSAALFNGDERTVGIMTSGGTESILCAVHAYRERARKTRPWIRRPEIVAPKTLHVAFDKAAHYFGIRMRYAGVDDEGRGDVKEMGRLIGRNTILVAASAPQYPHGVVDPIAAIGAICAKKKVPFHVDACFGGFILPWIERLGGTFGPFDFRVPGVTSLSADLHKYGFAAKGASVLLYRSMDVMKHQFFVATDWPGGIYASPTLAGTRPGGPIAAAWAALVSLGEDGYMQRARDAWAHTKVLAEGIEAIDGLALVAKPDCTVVAWRSAEGGPDLYAVADAMQARGWNIDRQQDPPSVHCTVNWKQGPAVERYLEDLRASVAEVRANPSASSEGQAPMYGMMAKLPVRGLVKNGVVKVLEGLYGASPIDDPTAAPAGDGLVDKLVAKYGDQAMQLFDKADTVRKRLRRKG